MVTGHGETFSVSVDGGLCEMQKSPPSPEVAFREFAHRLHHASVQFCNAITSAFRPAIIAMQKFSRSCVVNRRTRKALIRGNWAAWAYHIEARQARIAANDFAKSFERLRPLMTEN